ncbi:MAG: hypothetical protein HYX25_00700 [Candidatus Solibacter usitatus]|nr:hypothetical protein [Candidatus Solibacter usitatus]
MSSPPVPETQPRLRRELGLWALTFYGIMLIQPTALSYGRVARVYRAPGRFTRT